MDYFDGLSVTDPRRDGFDEEGEPLHWNEHDDEDDGRQLKCDYCNEVLTNPKHDHSYKNSKMLIFKCDCGKVSIIDSANVSYPLAAVCDCLVSSISNN